MFAECTRMAKLARQGDSQTLRPGWAPQRAADEPASWNSPRLGSLPATQHRCPHHQQSKVDVTACDFQAPSACGVSGPSLWRKPDPMLPGCSSRPVPRPRRAELSSCPQPAPACPALGGLLGAHPPNREPSLTHWLPDFSPMKGAESEPLARLLPEKN